jgi:hypothetical protein
MLLTFSLGFTSAPPISTAETPPSEVTTSDRYMSPVGTIVGFTALLELLRVYNSLIYGRERTAS